MATWHRAARNAISGSAVSPSYRSRERLCEMTTNLTFLGGVGSTLLTHTVPQCSLGVTRIIHDLRGSVEAHSSPAAKIVFRPTRVAIGRERNPGSMHGVRELLWRRR